MMLRFVVSFLAILAYMGLLAIPLYFATEFVDDDMLGFVILGFLAIILPTFPFVVDRIAKTIFRFRGEGVPVSEEALRKSILDINNFDVPVTVLEKGRKLVVTWKYLDAKWWDIMTKKGVQQTFRLVVKLDAKRHRATLIDIHTSAHWGAGPTGFRYGFSFFRGIYLEYKIGKAWGIREDFTLGKIYDYKFNAAQIHDPVMNTILRSGWDVRFGLF